jgi:signal transduction histidine kinase/ActR/RegA family two-component response regulator
VVLLRFGTRSRASAALDDSQIQSHGGVRQWWLDRSVRAKGLTVLAIPLLALIFITSASLALGFKEREQRRVAIVDLHLSSSANQVLSDAVNAETGVRGYLGTDDALFLDPYTVAIARLGGDRSALEAAAIAADQRVPERAIYASTSTVLTALARLRDEGDARSPARDLVPALEQEKVKMDLLRRQVASLAAAPSQSLAAQSKSITRLEINISRLNLVSFFVAVLAGLAGVGLFISGISRRIAEAAANAVRLGVGEPLLPVRPGADELGRLADSLLLAQTLAAERSAEIIEARDAAVRATDAKNVFLSHTSHELRTPLNSVMGFAQLLRMSDLNEEDRDGATRILDAGRHLLSLINELIDISRIESGDLNLSIERVSVLAAVEDASRLLTPLAVAQSIEIKTDCPNASLTVQADQQRLSQILVNLLSNAVKYGPRDGRIRISGAEGEAGQASVSVSDTGPGLTQEELARIFVPFERLGAAEAGIEGTGIGLPLSKALAEAMGGQLTALSTPGEGSVFTVTLPRAIDAIPVPRSAPGRSLAPVSPRSPRNLAGPEMSVLYIEDNQANVEVVSRYLRARPHVRLVTVSSGRSGIVSAISQRPDLILLDLHLPDMYGAEVLSELKSNVQTASVPVVVLSADASPGVIQRLLAHGALSYLTKPLDLDLFGEIIDSRAAGIQERERLATPGDRQQ